jgi:hypothetical protein
MLTIKKISLVMVVSTKMRWLNFRRAGLMDQVLVTRRQVMGRFSWPRQRLKSSRVRNPIQVARSYSISLAALSNISDGLLYPQTPPEEVPNFTMRPVNWYDSNSPESQWEGVLIKMTEHEDWDEGDILFLTDLILAGNSWSLFFLFHSFTMVRRYP